MATNALLHLFCVWCASSLTACLVCYLAYELIFKTFCCCYISNSAGDNDSNDNEESSNFDGIVEAVNEINSDGLSMTNLALELDIGEEENNESVNADTDVEQNGSENRSIVIKRIVVKPWDPD